MSALYPVSVNLATGMTTGRFSVVLESKGPVETQDVSWSPESDLNPGLNGPETSFSMACTTGTLRCQPFVSGVVLNTVNWNWPSTAAPAAVQSKMRRIGPFVAFVVMRGDVELTDTDTEQLEWA